MPLVYGSVAADGSGGVSSLLSVSPFNSTALGAVSVEQLRLVISAPHGAGAKAVATVDANGTIVSIQVVNSGTSRYFAVPEVRIPRANASSEEGLATAVARLSPEGKVVSVTVVEAGWGYATNATVTVTFESGVQAEGSLSAGDSNDVITAALTGAGSGYSAPNCARSADALEATNGPACQVQAEEACRADGNGCIWQPANGDVAASCKDMCAFSDYNQSCPSPACVHVAPAPPPYIRVTGAATATAHCCGEEGQLDGVELVQAGLGYTAAPTAKISAGLASAVAAVSDGGSVRAFEEFVLGGGYDPAHAVTVAFGDGGGGSGAQAEALVVNGHERSTTGMIAGTVTWMPPTDSDTTVIFNLCFFCLLLAFVR